MSNLSYKRNAEITVLLLKAPVTSVREECERKYTDLQEYIMGCFKESSTPEKVRNKDIERKLKEWNKDYKKAIKILLLGTGESGKTTIIKQMKILHISGFTDSERQQKIFEIRHNVHESIYDLVTHMSLLSPPITLANERSYTSANFIRSLSPEIPTEYSDEYYDHVEILWSDQGIKDCYQRSNEFQLIDSARYFLDRVYLVRQPDYVPSDQDILHSRKKTTAIQKIEFSMKVPVKYGGGSQEFWMFDVGGQRGERRKWIQVFEGINAILFLVASSDFDQTLREEQTVNRLKEALKLFQDVWQSKYLQDAGVIVFLNKQDVLKEKVQSGKSIARYFPDYTKYELNKIDYNNNEDLEYLKTRCFIRDSFQEITKQKRPSQTRYEIMKGLTIPVEDRVERQCYFHFTTATDTNNIKTVFDDVHIMILMSVLSEVGLQ